MSNNGKVWYAIDQLKEHFDNEWRIKGNSEWRLAEIGKWMKQIVDALDAPSDDHPLEELQELRTTTAQMLHALKLCREFGSKGETPTGESVSHFVDKAILKAKWHFMSRSQPDVTTNTGEGA